MNHWLRNAILLVLMLAASGLAVALRPTHKLAEQGPKIDLETMIPGAFGDWREEKQSSAQIVDPQTKEMIEKIYSQTLTRTYANTNGYKIMLSIAYGGDQSDAMQMHKPEVCYPAQGFELLKKTDGKLATEEYPIPVTRISTRLGQRQEPVTYWTTVGGRVVQGGVQKKIAEMSYGLSGEIPDGMLIRVSSIDGDAASAYKIQDRFAAEMLSAVTSADRSRLGGVLGPR